MSVGEENCLTHCCHARIVILNDGRRRACLAPVNGIVSERRVVNPQKRLESTSLKGSAHPHRGYS